MRGFVKTYSAIIYKNQDAVSGLKAPNDLQNDAKLACNPSSPSRGWMLQNWSVSARAIEQLLVLQHCSWVAIFQESNAWTGINANEGGTRWATCIYIYIYMIMTISSFNDFSTCNMRINKVIMKLRKVVGIWMHLVIDWICLCLQ